MLLDGLGPAHAGCGGALQLVAHKILETLGQPYMLSGHPAITPNIRHRGVPGQALNGTEDLLKKADVAVAQASQTGAMAFVSSTPPCRPAHWHTPRWNRNCVAAWRQTGCAAVPVHGGARQHPQVPKPCCAGSTSARDLVAPGAALLERRPKTVACAMRWDSGCCGQRVSNWYSGPTVMQQRTGAWPSTSARVILRSRTFVDQISHIVHATGADPVTLPPGTDQATSCRGVDRAQQRMRSLHAMGVQPWMTSAAIHRSLTFCNASRWTSSRSTAASSPTC